MGSTKLFFGLWSCVVLLMSGHLSVVSAYSQSPANEGSAGSRGTESRSAGEDTLGSATTGAASQKPDTTANGTSNPPSGPGDTATSSTAASITPNTAETTASTATLQGYFFERLGQAYLADWKGSSDGDSVPEPKYRNRNGLDSYADKVKFNDEIRIAQ